MQWHAYILYRTSTLYSTLLCKLLYLHYVEICIHEYEFCIGWQIVLERDIASSLLSLSSVPSSLLTKLQLSQHMLDFHSPDIHYSRFYLISLNTFKSESAVSRGREWAEARRCHQQVMGFRFSNLKLKTIGLITPDSSCLW